MRFSTPAVQLCWRFKGGIKGGMGGPAGPGRPVVVIHYRMVYHINIIAQLIKAHAQALVLLVSKCACLCARRSE